MKKAFISILLFYYTLHFLIPGTYFLISGYYNLYSDVSDWPATFKGFYLNSIMILGSILIIWFLPAPKEQIKPKFYDITKLLYFALLFSVIYYIARGGFEGAISGNMGGSLMS